MRPIRSFTVALSGLVAVAAAVASAVTLAWSGSFPDPTPAPPFNAVLAEARGWSLATLTVALPTLLVSLSAARRGSLSGRLIWLGALAYFVYTYLELAVSPPFSALYLAYVLAFACAIPALVAGVLSVDLGELGLRAPERIPRRGVAFFALLTSSFLSLAWLRGIVSRSASGEFGWPAGEAAVGHVVHALDLGLQVPLGIATGILLLRRRPGGYLAGAVFLINAVCMGAALTAMVAASALSSGASLSTALPFATLPVVAGALSFRFFRALEAA